MSIWVHRDKIEYPKPFFDGDQCFYCHNKLSILKNDEVKSGDCNFYEAYDLKLSTLISVCPLCGWWRAEKIQDLGNIDDGGVSWGKTKYGAAGALKTFSSNDIEMPLNDVRDYLIAKYDVRFKIHPRIMEEVVVSVFNDIGYKAQITAYSGDDGIDVILKKGNETIGVQVKRYENSIEAEQIRSLAGALVLEGCAKGIFVTTSKFRKGAIRTAKKYEQKGYLIELIDADKFLDTLSIAQREMYKDRRDFDFEVDIVLNDLKQIEDTGGFFSFDM